jgi:hypothetical protein
VRVKPGVSLQWASCSPRPDLPPQESVGSSSLSRKTGREQRVISVSAECGCQPRLGSSSAYRSQSLRMRFRAAIQSSTPHLFPMSRKASRTKALRKQTKTQWKRTSFPKRPTTHGTMVRTPFNQTHSLRRNRKPSTSQRGIGEICPAGAFRTLNRCRRGKRGHNIFSHSHSTRLVTLRAGLPALMVRGVLDESQPGTVIQLCNFSFLFGTTVACRLLFKGL